MVKLLTSVQFVPFQDSVSSLGPGEPPKTKPAVVVPAAPPLAFAVFKSLTSVQLVPLYISVIAVPSVKEGAFPPVLKEAS